MTDKKIKLTIFFIILSIAQIHLLDIFCIFSVKLDLLVTALVSLGLNYSLGYVLGFGFFLGFLQDMSSNSLWGINSLIFPLIGYLVYRISNTLVIESLFLKLLIIALAIILLNIIKGTFFYLLSPNHSIIMFLKIIFISLFFTISLSVLILKIMDFICQQERYL